MHRLTPKLHAMQRDFVEDSSLVNQVVSLGGSPVNIIIPELMDGNYLSFADVINKHGINAKIFYAHKVNQSPALVQRMEYIGGNIDVASFGELVAALSAGFKGDRILLNGPKNKDFIRLGIQQSCLISVDNIEELQSIADVASRHKIATKVLLRLALQTSSLDLIKDTRFGINQVDLLSAFRILKGSSELTLLGFSFHIDTTELSEKVSAFSMTMKVIEKSYDEGFRPEIIDIGGGFKVSYLESEKEWNDYTSAIREGILDTRKQITWNNAAYGLKLIEGTLRGRENYYRYFENIVGADFLDSFLDSPLKEYDNAKVSDLLKDFMLTLFIEPGRSLVYNTGLTIGKVIFKKRSLKGELLVGVDMNKSHLSSTEDELFIDPVHISNTDRIVNSQNEGVYLIGNLCQEHDLIFKHKVFLKNIPECGDLLVFPHTGAYHMDFNQTTAIKHPTPKKYILEKRGSKNILFSEEIYSPYK
jgi:diaminopimelate decarboxylase